jgi:phage terminase small subunit
MAGNANSGRKKTSVAEKKLKGTYRKDRDEKQEKAESAVSSLIAFDRDCVIKAPATLSGYPKIKKAFVQHAQSLIQLGLLSPQDVPELTMLYELLAQYTDVSQCLKTVDIVEDFEQYQALTHLRLNLQKQFSSLAARYYISPTARAKLTLDVLEIDKKKSENQNAISKILAKRNA